MRPAARYSRTMQWAWLRFSPILALLGTPQPAPMAPGVSPAVECAAPADPLGRTYRLEPLAPGGSSAGRARWQLRMRARETGDRWITLALPGAEPVFDRGAARLSYRNANGGRQVHLEVASSGSTLDVWVDHGLEVNIEPDLDPRVDTMSTDGPLQGVRCAILPPGSAADR